MPKACAMRFSILLGGEVALSNVGSVDCEVRGVGGDYSKVGKE